MRKQVNHDLTDCVKMVASYTGKELSACFNVKYKKLFNDENDILTVFCYHVTYAL